MSELGFTGTRQGMTASQGAVVLDYVYNNRPSRVHHGDCKGADADFHNIVRRCDHEIVIVTHPGMNSRGQSPSRAYCEADVERPVRPYLMRDGIIVAECDLLIATPFGYSEQRRSGTWATIRMAKRLGRRFLIVYPDGSTQTLLG